MTSIRSKIGSACNWSQWIQLDNVKNWGKNSLYRMFKLMVFVPYFPSFIVTLDNPVTPITVTFVWINKTWQWCLWIIQRSGEIASWASDLKFYLAALCWWSQSFNQTRLPAVSAFWDDSSDLILHCAHSLFSHQGCVTQRTTATLQPRPRAPWRSCKIPSPRCSAPSRKATCRSTWWSCPSPSQRSCRITRTWFPSWRRSIASTRTWPCLARASTAASTVKVTPLR